jgi:hypothetical protein
VSSDPMATARAVRLVLTGQAATMAKGAASNTVIDLSPLIPAWAMGSYGIGDVRMYSGYPYRCCQAHNSTGNPGWCPGQAPALWAPYHATDAVHALPWIAPTGAQDAYQVGECMIYTDGKKYRCKVANTVHSPEAYAQAWEVIT